MTRSTDHLLHLSLPVSRIQALEAYSYLFALKKKKKMGRLKHLTKVRH